MHEVVLYLSALLGLQEYEDEMQDWPLEVTDGARLREFCDLYQEGTPSQDTQDALMHILLCAIDDAAPPFASEAGLLEMGLDVQITRVFHWLCRDFARYTSLINYWVLNYWRVGYAPDPEQDFTVSPLMRHISNECETITQHHDEKRGGNS